MNNEENSMDIFIIENINDQEKHHSTLQNSNKKRFATQMESNQSKTNEMNKRQKGDLTCVICGGSAMGYNFNQITCESCKAFFRRNALQSIDKTKCLNILNGNRCEIRYDLKLKCQRCRLLKCFELGMRKDYILTPEEKRSKQQHLEENRRIRFNKKNSSSSSTTTTLINSTLNLLNEIDRCDLNHIQSAFSSSIELSPPLSEIVPLELPSDRMSIYMSTLELQNAAAMKLIHFLRRINEFEQLNEMDRISLVKYNLPLMVVLRAGLTFHPKRELVYDDHILNGTLSPSDEAFAQHYRSLYILSYGYQLNQEFLLLLHAISQIVNKDQVVGQLLLLILIFSKGLSLDDDQQPCLFDSQYVYRHHFKYIDLLFRYFMEKSSFNHALQQFIRINSLFIRIPQLVNGFSQYIKNTVDINYINPLMKSLLHLT